jgi:site-specific DNA-methyltransferase (adenine-specific)
MINEVHLIDNMEFMKTIEDNYFELAIVDPPYGIKRDGGETGKYWKWHEPKEWDSKAPDKKYFDELFRV